MRTSIFCYYQDRREKLDRRSLSRRHYKVSLTVWSIHGVKDIHSLYAPQSFMLLLTCLFVISFKQKWNDNPIFIFATSQLYMQNPEQQNNTGHCIFVFFGVVWDDLKELTGQCIKHIYFDQFQSLLLFYRNQTINA